jgi:hypothetical protein
MKNPLKKLLPVITFLFIVTIGNTQNSKIKPVFGLGYILNGSIKSDTVAWSDNMQGVTAYAQIEDVFSTLLEVNAQVRTGDSKIGFQYHFSGKFGAGAILFQKSKSVRRLKIPLYLTLGYAYTTFDKALPKNLEGISFGFQGGISFYVSQKLSIVGRYGYSVCYGGEEVIFPSKTIKDFNYTTQMISVGLAYSFLRNF